MRQAFWRYSVFGTLTIFLVGLAALGLSPAQATSVPPVPAGPINLTIPGTPVRVVVDQVGQYNLWYNGVPQIYGTRSEAVYIWAPNGQVWGPVIYPANWVYTPLGHTLSGTGTAGDPWLVTTLLDLPGTGLRLTQELRYVNGDDYLRNDWLVCNSGPAGTIHLFHATELTVDGNEWGFGYYNPLTGAIGGYNVDRSHYLSFVPIVPATHYEEDLFGLVWADILPGRGFRDFYEPIAWHMNGAGLEWIFTVGANACTQISDYVSYSTQPPLPGGTPTPSATPTRTPLPPTTTPLPPTATPTRALPTVTAIPPSVTATRTALPATATPLPKPSQTVCPPGTPTRVATPAWTPAPGCGPAPPAGVLSALITDHPVTTEARFTNRSATCSYRVGLAVYKKFDNNIDHQELYDYALAVIPPNSTLVLTANNPACTYQGDAFWGDILYSFAGGQRYGVRRLDDTDGVRRDYCMIRCTPLLTKSLAP